MTTILESSITGQRWQLAPGNERTATALSQRYQVPEIVGRLLAIRGFDLNSAADFLDPRLQNLLPDPFHLIDMNKAVERLVTAINNDEQIAIFGDYDVDGATSTALLRRYFSMLGKPVGYYIPDRMAEGYGPNSAAFDKLKERGVEVVITVDCGILAYEPMQHAKNIGLDVVITDHHTGAPELPEAVAVVNPNRFDEDSPYGYLAGVGVAFLLCAALNKELTKIGYFEGKYKPKLANLLDIVALGTVCDVVPLKDLNRAFVTQGLKVMAQRHNIGLRALSDVAKVTEAPGAYHLGFLLGPRINAGGRVGQSDLGTILLSTDDMEQAATVAQQLDFYNQERKTIEEGVQAAALEQVEQSTLTATAMAFGHDWHEGVIGIVAGRLKERYHRPACVMTIRPDGTAKGSGRSIGGIHLGNMIIAAKQEGLITQGGGHGMAAGFSLPADNIPDFIAFLEERIGTEVAEKKIRPTIMLDGELSPAGATTRLAQSIEQLGPFGAGNAQPRFVLPEAVISWAEIVGQGHVRCRIHNGSNGGFLKAMSFRSAETPLGQLLLGARGQSIKIVGTLKVDTWGREPSAQLFIEDAAV